MRSLVIDTNIIVRAFLSSKSQSYKLLEMWYEDKFLWVISNALFYELQDVLNRPEIKECYQLLTEEIDALLEDIMSRCFIVSPQEEDALNLSPDLKDNKVVDCAIAGEVDFIVTEDKKHLLLLNRRAELGKVQVVSVEDFLNIADKDL